MDLMSDDPVQADKTSRRLAIIMERVVVEGRWGGERWEAKGAVPDVLPPGGAHQEIYRDARSVQIAFPGLVLRLKRHEAQGYYLNITSIQPKVFVLWRMHDEIARPELLTVSYDEGARWIDGGENVDGVALPPDLLPWITEFVAGALPPGTQEEAPLRQQQGPGGRLEAGWVMDCRL
jgi:hypothetical protein